MAVRSWLDSDGNWTNAADWTGGIVPGSSDDAVISKAGSYTVSEDASSIAAIAVNSITISAAGAALEIVDVRGNQVGPGGIDNRATLGLAGTAALSVAGGVANRGVIGLDTASGDGGGRLTVAGTLDNSGAVQVGSTFSNLGAATVLALGGLVNRAGASFFVLGSASRPATLQFTGGVGFTSNAGTFVLSHAAPLTLGTAFGNSGTFALGGQSALTVAGDFSNSGTLDLDIGAGDGGGRLTIGGILTNTGAVQVGPSDGSLSAPARVSLAGLDNGAGGNLQIFGASSQPATVTVSGPADNAGNIRIDRFATLNLTGSNAFTQTGGTTTVSGALSAVTIDIEGGVLTVKAANFTNRGSLIAANGGKIDLGTGGLTNLVGTTLSSGSYTVEAGSIFQLPNNATVAKLAADLTLSGAGSVVRSLDTSTKAQVAIETTLTTIAAGGALSVLGGRSYTTTNALADAGSLVIGGGTFSAAGLNVAAAGTLEVDAGATLSLDTPLTIAGTATNAGTINGGGPTAVTMSGGRLVLDPGAAFGGTVRAGKGSILELAAGPGPGTLSGLGTKFSNFATVTVDPGAAWTVEALASALTGATISGSGGSNVLTLTSAGAATLAGVSGFPTINLAAGGNAVTLTDTTLSAGPVTILAGPSGNNSVSAGDTAASTGKTLTYIAGSGTDTFTGGFEDDVVEVGAAAVGRDTIKGGSGTNTLDLTGAGTVDLGKVLRFGAINLAGGNNTVRLGDSTLSGGSVAITAGATGNNKISAAGDSAASKGKTLTYVAGSGTDTFTGGFENDVVKVSAPTVSGDTLTGGSGTNTLDLTTAGPANLAGVRRFGTVSLARGTSTVTLFDTTLSGGAVTIEGDRDSDNTVSAAGDTAKSAGKTLTYVTLSGSGSFIGGFENDVVDASGDDASSAGKTFDFKAGSGISTFTGGFEDDAVEVGGAAVGGDKLTGGSGNNKLTLTSAGTFSLAGAGRFATIELAPGNNSVTLADNTLSGGAVTIAAGAGGNNRIDATRDTAKSAGTTLTYLAGVDTDSFAGGFENDVVKVSAAAVGGDKLTGGTGNNKLDLTSAGKIDLAGVGKFGTINLFAGGNTVTVFDNTLNGPPVTIKAGRSGANSISAKGDTAKSAGKTLSYVTLFGSGSFIGGFENDVVDTSKDGASSRGKTFTFIAGSGISNFTGGFENDVVKVSAPSVSGDTLKGGSGTNRLTLTSAGTVGLAKVSRFGAIDLAAGNNTVTLGDSTLSGGAVTITAGASGNNKISAAGDTAVSKGKTLTYVAGRGADSFAGNFENDAVKVSAAAVGGDTLKGGNGNNTLDLTSAGKVDLSGVSRFGTIKLFADSNTVTVADNTLNGGAVTIKAGASGTNRIDASSDTKASLGKTLSYVTSFGSGTFIGGFEDDVVDASKDGASSKGKTFTFIAGAGISTFAGGFENDVVKVSAPAVGGDTLKGGSGTNRLTLTSAGTIGLTKVSRFGAINLAAGNNTVTLADSTLSGGAVTITAGATGNNNISAKGDTAASAGKTLTYVAGTGTDSFSGGFENDVVKVGAAALGGDTLKGGSGFDTIELTSAGALGLSGISGFESYVLASSARNTLVLSNANFAGVGGALIMVFGGNSGNTLSGAALSSSNAAVLDGGSGADTLIAGRNEVLIGGAGADQFRLTTPGTAASPDTNTIADFTHGTDTLAFSRLGFKLGPSPVAATLFTANPTGSFTTTSQRFAYNTTTGALLFGAQGSAGSSREIATLSAHPTLTAGDITFVA